MIIATSGHVDHGKTSLVKSITGIETDRLAEEKKRGLPRFPEDMFQVKMFPEWGSNP